MSKRLIITIVILLILSAGILLRDSLNPVTFLQGAVQNIFSAPRSALYAAKTQILNDPEDELSKLKSDNRELITQMSNYQQIKKENETLKKQFASNQENPQNLLTAKVVGFEGRNSSPTKLIINKGEKDGVKSGMAVIEMNNLVGKIGSVSQKYSTVILPISREFSDIGMTLRTQAEGVIRGQEDFILFERIVITDTVEKDDTVVTKGKVNEKGIGVGPDLVVGKVKNVSKMEANPFQNAEVQSTISYKSLHTVFVVLP